MDSIIINHEESYLLNKLDDYPVTKGEGKFDNDGNPLHWPGCTIICPIQESSLVSSLLSEVQENFKKIAEVNSYTSLSWDASIASVPISLKKGFVYPIEMIHKEGTGDDFCAFGWTLPDGTLERPISGERFSGFPKRPGPPANK